MSDNITLLSVNTLSGEVVLILIPAVPECITSFLPASIQLKVNVLLPIALHVREKLPPSVTASEAGVKVISGNWIFAAKKKGFYYNYFVFFNSIQLAQENSKKIIKVYRSNTTPSWFSWCFLVQNIIGKIVNEAFSQFSRWLHS